MTRTNEIETTLEAARGAVLRHLARVEEELAALKACVPYEVILRNERGEFACVLARFQSDLDAETYARSQAGYAGCWRLGTAFVVPGLGRAVVVSDTDWTWTAEVTS